MSAAEGARLLDEPFGEDGHGEGRASGIRYVNCAQRSPLPARGVPFKAARHHCTMPGFSPDTSLSTQRRGLAESNTGAFQCPPFAVSLPRCL